MPNSFQKSWEVNGCFMILLNVSRCSILFYLSLGFLWVPFSKCHENTGPPGTLCLTPQDARYWPLLARKLRKLILLSSQVILRIFVEQHQICSNVSGDWLIRYWYLLFHLSNPVVLEYPESSWISLCNEGLKLHPLWESHLSMVQTIIPLY